MDIQRQAFEKEYNKHHPNDMATRLQNGNYSGWVKQASWEMWQQAQKSAVPETPKHKNGYYIRDLRNPIGNCMKFWYQCGYGTKHKNFFWCETLEEAKKYQGGCDWFEIWHAPYIDSLVEHTVDFQLADRNIGFVDLKAQEQGHE